MLIRMSLLLNIRFNNLLKQDCYLFFLFWIWVDVKGTCNGVRFTFTQYSVLCRFLGTLGITPHSATALQPHAMPCSGSECCMRLSSMG